MQSALGMTVDGWILREADPNRVRELLSTVGADGAQEVAIPWHARALGCFEDGELVHTFVGALFAGVDHDAGLKHSLEHFFETNSLLSRQATRPVN